jgi:hypothetical protein
MVNALGDWRPILWLVFAFSAAVLVLIIFFADESWYDRTLEVQPVRPTGVYGRFLNLTGVTAFRERKLKAKVVPSIMRSLEIYSKPVTWIVRFSLSRLSTFRSVN